MNFNQFLKALSIFNIISNIAATFYKGAPVPKAEVSGVVNDAINGLVGAGHLPADFGADIGNIIADVATMHPAVKNE